MKAKSSPLNRRHQPDPVIYREDAVRKILDPNELKLYTGLCVEDQVTVAHMLLTLMHMNKAKALLHALTQKREPGTASNDNDSLQPG